MEGGGEDSAGIKRSSAASTSRRSSSKKGGSFIGAGTSRGPNLRGSSRFVLPFEVERFGGKLAIGFFQKNLHAAFGLFELLLALARKRYPFFEKFHGVVERDLRTFEAPHHFFEARERALKIGFLGRLGLLWCRCVHAIACVNPREQLFLAIQATVC